MKCFTKLDFCELFLNQGVLKHQRQAFSPIASTYVSKIRVVLKGLSKTRKKQNISLSHSIILPYLFS